MSDDLPVITREAFDDTRPNTPESLLAMGAARGRKGGFIWQGWGVDLQGHLRGGTLFMTAIPHIAAYMPTRGQVAAMLWSLGLLKKEPANGQ